MWGSKREKELGKNGKAKSAIPSMPVEQTRGGFCRDRSLCRSAAQGGLAPRLHKRDDLEFECSCYLDLYQPTEL